MKRDTNQIKVSAIFLQEITNQKRSSDKYISPTVISQSSSPVYSMARYKQLHRLAKPSLPRSRPELARMTASSHKPWPKSFPKRPKKSEMDLSAEVRALELDASNNPFPESTKPRQPPATTRYHGKTPRKAREKMQHPKSWRKQKVPSTMTDPEVSPNLDDDPPPLTNLGDKHLATPEVPPTRRSETRTQPEVIDLTGED